MSSMKNFVRLGGDECIVDQMMREWEDQAKDEELQRLFMQEWAKQWEPTEMN